MFICIYLLSIFAFFAFCMSDHIFGLTGKNSDVAGHMSFQKRKTKLEPRNSLASWEKEIHKRWLPTLDLKEFCLYDVLVLSWIPPQPSELLSSELATAF